MKAYLSASLVSRWSSKIRIIIVPTIDTKIPQAVYVKYINLLVQFLAYQKGLINVDYY